MGYTNEPWSQYRPSDARKPPSLLPSLRRVLAGARLTVCQSSSSSPRPSATRCGSQSSSSEPPASDVDIRIRVKGGGYTSQIYAIRQALAKALVAWYQKFVDEASKKEIKEILQTYDRSLLVADPRRCEPKKFGG